MLSGCVVASVVPEADHGGTAHPYLGPPPLNLHRPPRTADPFTTSSYTFPRATNTGTEERLTVSLCSGAQVESGTQLHRCTAEVCPRDSSTCRPRGSFALGRRRPWLLGELFVLPRQLIRSFRMDYGGRVILLGRNHLGVTPSGVVRRVVRKNIPVAKYHEVLCRVAK